MSISIDRQAAAAEISVSNLRGHIDNLTRLVEAGKRNPVDLQIAKDRYPELEAAALTLRQMATRSAA
jgi:hypothetical protein